MRTCIHKRSSYSLSAAKLWNTRPRLAWRFSRGGPSIGTQIEAFLLLPQDEKTAGGCVECVDNLPMQVSDPPRLEDENLGIRR